MSAIWRLCDGPVLLTWVGAYRRTGPHDARDEALVTRIAGAVRSPRLARRFGVAQAHAVLEVVLEAYPGELYLVGRDGNIEHANACGAERLARDGKAAVRALRSALDEAPSAATFFDVHEIRARGTPTHYLVARRSALATDFDGRLRGSATRWKLTARQTQVLARLSMGDANKDIAVYLHVGVRTVEQHVATIMARARVESRLRLVATFWRGEE